MSNIERVVVDESTHKQTTSRGDVHIYSKWRYTAIMDDGTEEVIRKSATRRYANAFMHGHANRSWSFGKKPGHGWGVPVVATYPVQDR